MNESNRKQSRGKVQENQYSTEHYGDLRHRNYRKSCKIYFGHQTGQPRVANQAGNAHDTAHGEAQDACRAHIGWHAHARLPPAASAHRVGQQRTDDAPSAQEHWWDRVLPSRIQNPTGRAVVTGNQLEYATTHRGTEATEIERTTQSVPREPARLKEYSERALRKSTPRESHRERV